MRYDSRMSLQDSKTLDIDGRLHIPIAEFDFSYARSSGPGGQNVNKVNSKVVMYWPLGVSPSLPHDVLVRFRAAFGHRIATDGTLVLGSDRFRDQKRNVQDCLEKLAEMLRQVLDPPKPRKKTKPGRGAVERRLAGKRATADKKKMRRQRPEY
jgi:ribosome-associated protein